MDSMYSVTVQDHIMIAHSLRGEVFGPSQRLHGATYVVDVTFTREEVDADGIVVDIGLATDQLHDVLAAFDRRNLDDDATFATRNSTTELLAREIADRLVARIHDGALGPGAREVREIAVMLQESPTASAGYRRAVRGHS